jgi:glycosyltransferase involved in cell wall biosynthesis
MDTLPPTPEPLVPTARLEADDHSAPLLGIGLAVYNGEKYLRQALDTLLAQDINDLELVISDNASTDRTQAICMEYAAADSRIRYSRNDRNIGAASNFNRVFELSRGKYFMWGSDDDLWDPRFARLCVERLERSPQAVLCTSVLGLIDEEGSALTGWPYRNLDTEGMSVESRVHELIARTSATSIYGVIRHESLRATGLMSPDFGSDIRVLLELLLMGESLVVRETLFHYRLPESLKTARHVITELAPDKPEDVANRELKDPWGDLARRLLNLVRASGLDEATVSRIEEVFVLTFSHENLDWGGAILARLGVSQETLRSVGATESAVRTALGLNGSVETPDYIVRDHAPWNMLPGMRLRWARRALLRTLRPFGDRQNGLDAEHSGLIAILAAEVQSLRHTVSELERRVHASEEDKPAG